MVHTIHVVLAGAWPGGVLFTAFVVSPALEVMKWVEAERVGVRAEIGRRSLQKLSLKVSRVSWANLEVSVVVRALAANA